MTSRKNRPQRNGGNSQTTRTKSGIGTAQVMGAARQYASALMRGDEDTLNRMTLYNEGSIGSKGSNISALKRTGATRVLSAAHNGKTALVAFGREGSSDPVCIGAFTIVDGGHVMGDWSLFTPTS